MHASDLRTVFVDIRITQDAGSAHIEVSQAIQSTGQSTHREFCHREGSQSSEFAGPDPGIRG
jgi:hypothetical protein